MLGSPCDLLTNIKSHLGYSQSSSTITREACNDRVSVVTQSSFIGRTGGASSLAKSPNQIAQLGSHATRAFV